MDLEQRIDLLKKLGQYLLSGDAKWTVAKRNAALENPWFMPEFIDYQVHHIATAFLQEEHLLHWVQSYRLPDSPAPIKNVGIVMAGNIPLAGFHDFLCAFISGHRQIIKPSAKDSILIRAIAAALLDIDPATAGLIQFAPMLKHCDAYIATGSNNSGRYFDYYFSKYPHIIRRNRTSVAILDGNENLAQLGALADDVYLYFGLGCRNVTKIYVPRQYDFLPLLESFKKYDFLADNYKYKNNYDYQLAVLIINKLYYMTNGSVLLQENPGLFSPVSQLHYEYYDNVEAARNPLIGNPDIQCIVSRNDLPFGSAQQPAVNDYADKADTLKFLLEL